MTPSSAFYPGRNFHPRGRVLFARLFVVTLPSRTPAKYLAPRYDCACALVLGWGAYPIVESKGGLDLTSAGVSSRIASVAVVLSNYYTAWAGRFSPRQPFFCSHNRLPCQVNSCQLFRITGGFMVSIPPRRSTLDMREEITQATFRVIRQGPEPPPYPPGSFVVPRPSKQHGEPSPLPAIPFACILLYDQNHYWLLRSW